MLIFANAQPSSARDMRTLAYSILFFLSPSVTTAIPRLTWLFLPLVGLAFVIPVFRRSNEWRVLSERNSTAIACLLVPTYIFVNALWAADQRTAVVKALLLSAVVLIALLAGSSLRVTEGELLRRSGSAFVVGPFVAALFFSFELLTDGAITRFVLNSINVFHTLNHKHATAYNGQIVHLRLADLNQNTAILMFNLWPSLLALRLL